MKKRVKRTEYRRFADISASLPKKVELGIDDYFDEDVLEKNILLPKKEFLNEHWGQINSCPTDEIIVHSLSVRCGMIQYS